jgi:hypothetical protein
MREVGAFSHFRLAAQLLPSLLTATLSWRSICPEPGRTRAHVVAVYRKGRGFQNIRQPFSGGRDRPFVTKMCSARPSPRPKCSRSTSTSKGDPARVFGALDTGTEVDPVRRRTPSSQSGSKSQPPSTPFKIRSARSFRGTGQAAKPAKPHHIGAKADSWARQAA